MSEIEMKYWVAEIKASIIGNARRMGLQCSDIGEEIDALEHIAATAAKALGYTI